MYNTLLIKNNTFLLFSVFALFIAFKELPFKLQSID